MGHMGKGVSCVLLKIEMRYLGGWGTWAMGHMIIIVGKMSIMVNTEDRDGAPWGMGHMGHGAHGQCGHVLDHVQLP